MSQRSHAHAVSTSIPKFRPAGAGEAPVRAFLRAAAAAVEELECRRLMAAEVATPANAFIDSIGINTHFNIDNQSTNPYDQTPTVALLGQLGVHHIRDNPKNATGDGRIQTLYDTYGVRTMIPAANTGAVSGLMTYVNKPYTEAAEGLNEPDNWIRTYQGYTDNPTTGDFTATRRYNDDYYNAVKAAGNKTFVTTAMGAPLRQSLLAGTQFDVSGVHLYPGTSSPGGNFKIDSYMLPEAQELAGGKPVWATEAGYHTSTDADHISETAQGKYVPRLFAEYFNKGVDRTYLYEFADEFPDGSDNEARYGIIHNDRSPKAAYTNLKNMISLLSDSTWNTSTKTWSNPSFTADTLDYTISTSNPSIHHRLLQKSNGEFDLMIWNESSGYSGGTDVSVPTTPVTLTFNNQIAQAAYFGLSSTTATQTWNGPTSITINVPDEVTILRLTPGTLPITTQDVGSPAVAGSASVSGSTYTLTGGGADIWGTNDQFRYAYQTLSGDADVITRVNGFANSQPWAKAGIMVRQSLAGNAADAGVFVTGSNGAIFQNRQPGGALSSFTTAGISAPTWLKLSRRGSVFTAYTSATGADGSWTQLGTTYTVAMTGTVYVGLAVSSHDAASTATATFDNVSITGPTIDGTSATPDSTLASAPVVSISSTDATATENGTTLPTDNGFFVVTRTGPTTSTLTIPYTLGGSAANGTDYASLSGTVTIPAGSSSATIVVSPLNDSLIEGDEFVMPRLTSGSGYRIAADGRTAQVKLKDYAADLIITGVRLSNPNPKDGDAEQFIATIQNVGNAPLTGLVKIGFLHGSNGSASLWNNTTTLTIQPGATADITSNAGAASAPGGVFSASAGHRLVTAWLDATSTYSGPADTLPEASDRNNQFVWDYVVDSTRVADSFDGLAAGTSPTATGWTTTGDGWGVKTDGGQPFLENSTTGTGTRSISRGLGVTHTGSWSLDFAHAWRFGGTAQGHGQSSIKLSADVLNASGDGYRVRFLQGDSDGPTATDQQIQIYKVTGGNEGTALATSTGFNTMGWKSLGGLTSPNWRRVRITYDAGTRKISVLADLAGNGTYALMASAYDLANPVSNFTTLAFNAENLQNGVGPELDDIRLDLFV